MVGSWVPGKLLGVPGRFLGSLFFCLTPAALGVPTSRGYPKAVHPRFGQLHPAAGHPKPHSYVTATAAEPCSAHYLHSSSADNACVCGGLSYVRTS